MKQIQPLQMLKQQQLHEQSENPLIGIFEEGVDAFVISQKQRGTQYISRATKNKVKIQKMVKDMNDPQLKKKRHLQRRQAEKAKIRAIMQGMNQEQIRDFIQGRKKTKAEKRLKVREGIKIGQPILIDLVFESKMNGKENKSLAKQIELITKAINHVEKPPSIHLCNLQEGVLKPQLQKMGYNFWPVTVHTESIVEVGNLIGKKLIYLSPDAELSLDTIEDNCAFILGGLIDRTIIKNASLNRARSLGIQARKLPIKQFMKSRLCLNLDHVVMMLCKFKQTGNWKTAFDYGAPKRWKKDFSWTKQEDSPNKSESSLSNDSADESE